MVYLLRRLTLGWVSMAGDIDYSSSLNRCHFCLIAQIDDSIEEGKKRLQMKITQGRKLRLRYHITVQTAELAKKRTL